jgi:hypothetical protein
LVPVNSLVTSYTTRSFSPQEAILGGGNDLGLKANFTWIAAPFRMISIVFFAALQPDLFSVGSKTLPHCPLGRGPNGYPLAVSIRSPDVKSLLTSRFPGARLTDLHDVGTSIRALSKPSRKEELTRAIHEIRASGD